MFNKAYTMKCCNTSTLLMIVAIFLAAIFTCIENVTSAKVTYTFVEFPYKETPKNEATFHEFEAACGLTCSGRHGITKVLCVRQCLAPSCYKDLYQNDLLEEGEVDVRLNSFKGCFIQRYHRTRT